MKTCMCEGHLAPARAYVACLRTSWVRKHTYPTLAAIADFLTGDLPTAIMAGVTHNNADVIAPRSRFHRTSHISQR